ncbi:antibiotic ABC transporter permease [Haloarcula pelagica]|uniref:antibiotic ABC transporter permease n=1 Tax=Haloarcula pelagica TaxID=3033389 RepID=UPI0024C2E6B1|nr:antibiotic ABC transporter permease [Halomicroarcula sp. YJ-61-S]
MHQSPAAARSPSVPPADTDRARQVLEQALAYAADREYTGWDYADGLSSRFRTALPVENRWLNLAFQEGIKRTPVNVRPLFLVEQRRSFMGAGLFVLVHRILDRLPPEHDGFDHRAAACRLADWLVDNRCRGYSGFCGGHRHDHQHLDHKTTPAEPDVVTTAVAVKGLLAAADYDDRYADIARTAERFLVEDMRYRTVDGTARIDYYPQDRPAQHTLNATAMAAQTFLDLYERVGRDRLRQRAAALLDFVVGHQTDRGGWYYRVPASASHLSMDTHHNCFVVESLLRYHEVTGTDRYAESLADALAFLRRSLFRADGAPNWDETASYPRDVHAAAQGILAFTAAGDHAFAGRIVAWLLDTLYVGGGRFAFRKHRLYTERTTLMRWCQAWPCYALATYLQAVRNR